MKKLLFFVLVAAMFCGCDKEEKSGAVLCPVTGVELPASGAENPVQPGTSVTVRGDGFTEASQIWLRAVTRAADVRAEVTGVTATAITFVAPEVSGAQNILLKQDGGEWSLGKMYFAEGPNPGGGEEPTTPALLPNKVSHIRVTFKDEDKGDYVTGYAFTYDKQGRIAELMTTDEDDVLTTTYTYSDNSILAESSGTGYIRSRTEKYTLTDERVSNYTTEIVDGGKADEGAANTLISVRPKYDDNGYMIGTEGTETGNDNGYKWSCDTYESLTFIDGTLQKYSAESKYKSKWNEEEEESGNGMTEIEFTAGPLNNLNIDLMGIDWLVEDVYFTPVYLLNIGGNRSLRLPNLVHTIYDDGAGKDGDYTNEIRYEMHGEYISVIRVSRDGALVTIVEIDYEKE